MRKNFFKGLFVAVFVIKFAFAENTVGYGVARKADYLNVLGNKQRAFYTVLFNIKKDLYRKARSQLSNIEDWRLTLTSLLIGTAFALGILFNSLWC